MDPLSWDDLRLFLAAYQSGSLSAAAERLGLGQATLSRRIAALEAAIGRMLFDRTRTGLVPTEAALRLLPHAEAMAAHALGAHSALQGLEEEPAGLVRVALPEGIGVDIVAPLLPALYRRYPKLRVELLAENRLVDLGRREADLALRGRRPEGEDLLAQRLPDVPIGLYAAPSLVQALPRPIDLEDLPLLQYSADLLDMPIARWLEQLAPGRTPILSSNSFLVLRAAAAAGVGAMALPSLQARPVGLVEIPVEIPPLEPVPWYLVVPRPLRSVPRVAVLVDLIGEAIREGVGQGSWPPPRFR